MEERKISVADLKKIQPLSALHKKTLEELADIGTIKVYQPDSLLYRAGETNSKLVIILRGQVFLGYHFKQEDRDVPIEVLEDGELWGYTTLLKPGKKYPYSLQNGSRVTEAIELPVAKILSLTEKTKSSHSRLIYELAQLQRERSSSRQARVALLTGLANLINTEIISDHILESTLTLALDSLNAERALVASFDDISKKIQIEATVNFDKKISGARYPLSTDTLLSMVYNSGNSFIITKKNFERKFKSSPYCRDSMLIVPLYIDNAVYGAILLADKIGEKEFSVQDWITLNAAAPFVTSALAHKHREQYRQGDEIVRREFIPPFG